MPTYRFECEPCEGAFEIRRLMSQSPGDTAPCPGCGAPATRDWRNVMPLLLVGGEIGEDYMLDASKPGLAPGNGRITAAQQRDMNAKHVREQRAQARQTQLARRNTKRVDGEIRHVGSVPVDLFRCAQRTSGDRHYWFRKPKETLRKHGLLFDE